MSQHPFFRLFVTLTIWFTAQLLPASPVYAQPGTATATTTAQITHSENRVADLSASIADYQKAIEEMDGNYDVSSIELLLSLAAAQIEAGNLADASLSYQDALQAMRINEGFATEWQLQVLKQYDGLLFQLQDWEKLDTNLHLALDINRRLYNESDDRFIQAATALASWKIRAYQTRLYRPGGDRSVREAAEIYRVILRDLPKDNAYLARRATFHSAMGLAHFYSAQHVAGIPVNEFQPTASQNLSPQYCVPLILSVDGAMPAQTACSDSQIRDPEYYASQQRNKNNTVRRHLGNMRESFLAAITAIEADPQSTLEDQVRAILNLGDANLLAEDHPRARTQYGRAWEMLSGSEESILLRTKLMGNAVQVLNGILEDLPLTPQLQLEGPKGLVSFDVTETGEIININVRGTDNAQDQENIGAIAMRLAQSYFRPKIEDGRPVQSRIEVPAASL